MTVPAWFSQPFPPEGASAAEGIRNQLGKPEMDRLTILMRESAQNSWDARCADGRSVDYRIDLATISAAHAQSWRDNLLRKAPAKQHLPLRDSLQKPIIRVLSISDRGTRGLGGPTRADVVTEQSRDFIAFLRNIGEPRSQELGGGTYGFGKGILYLVSKAGTILVHTRCRYEGRYETRLMAAALWRSYDSKDADGDRRYTGRHWWGDTSGEVIEPLVGTAADAMAAKLGLAPFGPTETGTTVAIVDPDLEDRDPADAAAYLAETIVWHLWPKMLAESGPAPMRFSVTCDGIDYPVPDPTTIKPLRMFFNAYRKMCGEHGDELRWRNTRLLGRLGLIRTIAPRFEPSEAAKVVGFEDGMVHHVCLMRPAELVVSYWPGPKPAGEVVAYAGVFRADEAMDETYAAAEPPTHDSWNPQSLDYPASSHVRVTFQRFKERIEALVGLNGRSDVEFAQVSLGAASDKLAPLISGAWGIGSATDYGRPGNAATKTQTRRRRRRPSGAPTEEFEAQSDEFDFSYAGSDPATEPSQARRPRKRRPRVEYVGEPYVDELWGNLVVIQEFRLPTPLVQRITADLAVALTVDGGLEDVPPEGADMPGVVGWQDPAGRLHETASFVIEGGDGGTWKVIVKPARDTMTDIVLRAKAVES